MRTGCDKRFIDYRLAAQMDEARQIEQLSFKHVGTKPDQINSY